MQKSIHPVNNDAAQKKVNIVPDIARSFKASTGSGRVCQLFCAFCGQDDCNNGSKCGHSNIEGTYGFRTVDQKLLGTSGKTYEAEHSVGFSPANALNSFTRKSKAGKAYEASLPAYQEKYAFHRQNIGTGTKSAIDASGFNSNSYRETQQSLIGDNHFAAAVQINQLTYASLAGFSDEPMGTSADQSFNKMAMVPFVPFPNSSGTGYSAVPLTEDDRVEMVLSRNTARTHEWPTPADIRKTRLEVNSRRLFTTDEDDFIRKYVNENGSNNWDQLASMMVNRTARMCRERWMSYLAPASTVFPWTADDDTRLIELHSRLGNKWTIISSFFPGRTPISIKNRIFHLRKSNIK